MKTAPLLALFFALLLAGCAGKEKKSKFEIIPEGDRNPMIRYSPEEPGRRID